MGSRPENPPWQGLRGGSARPDIEERDEIDVRIDRVRVATFIIGGEGKRPGEARALKATNDALEVRLPVKAGARSVAVSFINRSGPAEGIRPARGYIGGFH